MLDWAFTDEKSFQNYHQLLKGRQPSSLRQSPRLWFVYEYQISYFIPKCLHIALMQTYFVDSESKHFHTYF